MSLSGDWFQREGGRLITTVILYSCQYVSLMYMLQGAYQKRTQRCLDILVQKSDSLSYMCTRTRPDPCCDLIIKL